MLKSTILSVIRPLSFLPKPCTPVIALEQNCSGLSYWKQYSTMKLEVPSHRFECLHFTAIVVAPALAGRNAKTEAVVPTPSVLFDRRPPTNLAQGSNILPRAANVVQMGLCDPSAAFNNLTPKAER